ncbi:hypothetical protein COT75_00830 [Candidatus Beckwithbacteria bacterium CG10_big_fil_rev_8_21_14_0_10_34_10]|uniref:Nudix hydrolase domain-containing protein n=1 Tax=Candidatus Beckwithbacteria bacterium CG10_big_fil_rev_8_21_14_0_10_34_10 TaxID=1974495 RepID=A0A2H0WA70_9BACT|nr:MAG: hypothetical protein COT75_00830 [Candidatus Beckwithbacteria bacterium CG10_big_fil_rev_8_21_14_0_10_34_10]
MSLKREYSAGCVVFKKEKAKILHLIGKHSGYHKWVLPKGLIEKGEKGPETAIRETEEEMGVKGKLVLKKPIFKEQYFFYADFKKNKEKERKIESEERKQGKPVRRVAVYQEKGGKKTKVFKTVSFFLAEFKSGDPSNHDWEMSEAGWFEYDKAFNLLAFKGEKQALKKAKEKISLFNQEKLL